MYRILSIDGGGLHGYASLTIIRRLLERKPDLLDKIDLIAGTSIGGIITLGIASGHTMQEIDSNFLIGMPYAFNTNFLRTAGFMAGMSPKYNNSVFMSYLQAIFGELTFGDLKKKTLITTFCVDNEKTPTDRRWQAKILHNFEGTDSDADFKVVDAAMATSAVPSFFPMYDKYIDGAFVNNNPSLLAMCQTQDKRCVIEPRPSMSDLSVLSFGSLKNRYITERDADWGYFGWISPLLELFTEKDVLITNYQCSTIIGDRYCRIQPIINAAMDDFGLITEIKDIAMAYDIESTVDWLNKNW